MAKIRVRITLDTSDEIQNLAYVFLDKLDRHKAVAVSSIIAQYLKNNGISIEDVDRLSKKDLLDVVKDDYATKGSINELVRANMEVVASAMSNALSGLINGVQQAPPLEVPKSPPGTFEKTLPSSSDSILEVYKGDEVNPNSKSESPPGTSGTVEKLDESIMHNLEGNFDID